MRIENGGEAGFAFDPRAFENGLNIGKPSRASQHRASDKAIAEKIWKPSKASCEGMRQEPIWQASPDSIQPNDDL